MFFHATSSQHVDFGEVKAGSGFHLDFQKLKCSVTPNLQLVNNIDEIPLPAYQKSD
jgi:hypothetical protein